jgi:nucleotide-binding universal stress UspA family protein
MIRSILIGLDTPDHVEGLTEMGIRWGRRSDATLVGLAIVDEPGIRAIEPLGPVGGKPGVNPVYYVGYENRMAEHQQKADRLLAEFADRCGRSVVAHEEVSGAGSPHEVIEREAGACDLILMAMRSHFCFTAHEDEADDGLLKRVLKDTPRPVVVVPGGPTPEGPVAIAYDGSLQAARALSAFQATSLGKSGQVNIISVSSSADEATQHADRARQFLNFHGIDAIPIVLESSDSPAKIILDQSERLGAGLLVMGAYGQPTLREFIVGSVTGTILRESPVPVFLFY